MKQQPVSSPDFFLKEGGRLYTGYHLGSWIWRETSPDYKRQIEDLFIPIIVPFIIIICIITKLQQIVTNYDSYYKLRQLLHVTTEQSFITFSPSVRSFLKNILKNWPKSLHLDRLNKGNVVVVQQLKNIIDQTIFDVNSL